MYKSHFHINHKTIDWFGEEWRRRRGVDHWREEVVDCSLVGVVYLWRQIVTNETNIGRVFLVVIAYVVLNNWFKSILLLVKEIESTVTHPMVRPVTSRVSPEVKEEWLLRSDSNTWEQTIDTTLPAYWQSPILPVCRRLPFEPIL